jgi:hypothetical protein
MKKKKSFPFKYGQRIKIKGSKRYAVVVSRGPAVIGDKDTCKIKGGPLIFNDYVFIKVQINKKYFICMEKISQLEKA